MRRTLFAGFRKPPDAVHSSCFQAVLELGGCRLCISRRFFLSSFIGQFGFMHGVHGRLPGIRTNMRGHPQVLQVLPVGLTVPLCGSGNEVLHAFVK